MKYNELDKLKLLNSLKEKAFQGRSINTARTQEISMELRIIPEDKRNKFYDFVKDYLELSFKHGLEDNNISLDDFKVINEKNVDEKVKEVIEVEKIEVIKSLTLFRDLFEKIKIELRDYFINYKGYFITELVNDRSLGYKLIFFYESKYHVIPLKGWVNNKFTGYECEFIEHNISNKIVLDQDKNYICIFLLMSKMNDKDGLKSLKDSINEFITGYQEFYYHSITEKDQALLHDNTNRKSDFIDEIECVLSTYISNGRINFEEEKIIKKLCSDFKSPLIFYKILSGGFSGSKVLEIRPKKTNNFENEKIYIIKYGYIIDGKIKEEKDNFNEFIRGRKGFSSYTDASYVKTLHYEGILYNYAISEKSKASYSFNDILKKAESPYSDIEVKRKIITKLFNDNEAFIKWREDFNEQKEAKVSEVYLDFVSKDKIEESLKYILDDTSKADKLINFFDKIGNYQIKYKETVCHGDLHTDNFFVDDEENIYLIDFGFTNKRHSVIDYTTLECSLKFKHFPFYLESQELIEIEKEFLSEKTFDLSYAFTSTKRKEVIELLSMINTIRHNSIKDFVDGSTIDYYISLFIMTIRQIRYPNMNQLYAYRSASILGEYIVNKLNL